MPELVMTPGTMDLARPLIQRAAEHDGASPVSDQAVLAAQQGQRDLFVFTAPGTAAAIAVGIIGQGELDLVVDPSHRGRGVGSAALAQLLGRAGNEPLLAWAHGINPAANTILSGRGFTPVRSLFKMELDPAKLPEAADPLTTEFPPGFALSRYAAPDGGGAATDAERWVRVNAAAFATHPEQGRITVQDFELMQQEPWFDAEDLMLLSAPGSSDLAGYTWVKTVRESAGSTEAELYAIGVDPRFAGQGLGRGLLEATLKRMAAHAPARVSLYVDGENTRAVRMYELAGFEVATRSQQWRRDAGAALP